MIHPWNRALWQELTADPARLPHAILLHGPKGVGKREFALDLAQWLLCSDPAELAACGQCPACNWFRQGSHPDFRLIEPAAESARKDGDAAPGMGEAGQTDEKRDRRKVSRQIGIDDIRELGRFLSLAAHQGGWRVVLLHPAELMNAAAANALLKTLEEPPARVLLILIAHQPRRLLPTVLSRCRRVAIALPSRPQARAWLEVQGLDAALPVLDEVGGAPLAAIESAEPDRLVRRGRFLDVLARPAPLELSALAQEYQPRLDEAWGWLTRWQYDLIAVQAAGSPRYFPEAAAALERLAAVVDNRDLWRSQLELLAAGRWLRHPLNPQLLLESWLLRYADLTRAGHGR